MGSQWYFFHFSMFAAHSLCTTNFCSTAPLQTGSNFGQILFAAFQQFLNTFPLKNKRAPWNVRNLPPWWGGGGKGDSQRLRPSSAKILDPSGPYTVKRITHGPSLFITFHFCSYCWNTQNTYTECTETWNKHIHKMMMISYLVTSMCPDVVFHSTEPLESASDGQIYHFQN